ncbi:MAG TPA: hypothetical protein PLG78_18495, partial [Leptospiraceae bacterium]|nr:hypothetical protein [Leptospiraceae bacterium]
MSNSFGAKAKFTSKAGSLDLFRLDALEKQGVGNVSKLPYSIRVLLESALRNEDSFQIHKEDV